MNGSVDEITEFVRRGDLFADAPVLEPRWRPVTSRSQVAKQSEAWVDLRELMASPVLGRAMTSTEKAEFWKLADEYEETLLRRYRRSKPWLVDDASGDLINVARARLTGEPSPFFEELYEAYRAGGVPCGWDGEYPAGALMVMVAS